MTKFHIGRLDLNTKKHFSTILEFSILRGGKGVKRRISKDLDFRKKFDFKLLHGKEISHETSKLEY